MNIEPLESRIAPAGLIVATLANGALTLTGGVDATNFTVEQIDAKTWAITGSAGTLIQIGAATPAALGFLTGVTGDVTVNFGNNADTAFFTNVSFKKNLTINAGAGNNGVFLSSPSIRGNLNYTGGAGFDTCFLEGYRVSVGGNVNLQTGDGGGGGSVNGEFATVGGNVTVQGGNGIDTLFIQGGAIKIRGGVDYHGGAAGAAQIVINPRLLDIGKGLLIEDSDAASTIEIAPQSSLRVGGKLDIRAGAGVDVISIGKGTGRVTLGSLAVNTAADADLDTVNITPGTLLDVKGDLLIGHASGAFKNTISADIIRIGGGVLLSSGSVGSGSARNDVFSSSELRVKHDFSTTTDATFVANTIFNRGTMDIGGSIRASATGGVSMEIGATSARIGRDIALDGDSVSLDLDIGTYAVKGSVLATGTTGALFDVNVVALSVGKDVTIKTTGGALGTDVLTSGAFKVGGTLRLEHNGTTFDAEVTVASGKIAGDAQFITGGTAANVELTGRLAALQIGGTLLFSSGATLGGTFAISGLEVRGAARFFGAGGPDEILVNDATFRGPFEAGLAGGSDALDIENASTLTRGRTLFAGTVSVLFGDANDSLRVAFPAGPFLGAVFQKSVNFDGGNGLADAGVFGTAAIFPPGQPGFINFEL